MLGLIRCLMTIYELTRSCPVHSRVGMCTPPASLQAGAPGEQGPACLLHPRTLSSNGAGPSVKCVDSLTERHGKHCDRSKDRHPENTEHTVLNPKSREGESNREQGGGLERDLGDKTVSARQPGCSGQEPSRHRSMEVGARKHCRGGRGEGVLKAAQGSTAGVQKASEG